MLITLLISIAFSSIDVDAETHDLGAVQSVYFNTDRNMPVRVVTNEYAPIFHVLKLGVENVPEGVQLTGAIRLFSNRFGLSPRQAAELESEFTESYRMIGADPACRGLPSALGEIFSTAPNRQGHYFAYVPNELSSTAPTIVFLHGFGGNLKFYIWALKEAFPDSVIIAPTWGIGWQDKGVGFVEEVCQDAKSRFNVELPNRWLIGLSAGGPAGFQLLNQTPPRYQGYACIASGLSSTRIAKLSFQQPVLMLNGVNDIRFPIEFVRHGIDEMQARGLAVETIEMQRDHFFLLSDRATTLRAIADFIEQHSAASTEVTPAEKPHWLLKFLNPWGLTFLGLAFVCVLMLLKRRTQRD